ncbi:hypothetical protein QQY66_47975 [Streptomyces sp. DG2A-72]|uniref:hypothetical protein n=1 Tax=Streptomyces sp. DG2A-72 TaxID=3051386 RepID=UPI00265BB174|nr:hypothetical protein [Streptomyces sp. DG2A-72]MDO0939076.1 hypothetical protein [Streptomyces sp. DG2A-72]
MEAREVIDKTDVSGIDPQLVIPFNRPDGTKQKTIDCRPLYWFTGDKAPADTKGQGAGGTWFAVAPDEATTLLLLGSYSRRACATGSMSST